MEPTTKPTAIGRDDSSAVALAIAALGLLCFLLARSFGIYDPLAVALLVPLILLLAALQLPRVSGRAMSPGPTAVLAAGALACQAATLVSHRFGIEVDVRDPARRWPVGLPTALILGIGFASLDRRVARSTLAALALIAAFATTSACLLRDGAKPGIDVFVFQQEAARGLARGVNPYAMRMPNLYGTSTPLYSPAVIDGDRVTFGYPYTPLPLLTETPSGLLLGDVRYAHVAGVVVAMLVLTGLGAGRWALFACAMLALMPDLQRVFTYGWTEPLMLPWLALAAWGLRRRRTLVAAASFGLFLASKQYCVIFAPLLWFFVPSGASRADAAKVFAVAIGAASLVTLPLALWDAPAFWYSAATIQLQQPFRDDALSLAAGLRRWADAPHVAALAFVLLVPAYALIFARATRTPSGLALAVALVAAIFFAFNKQAFLNYYLLVVGALVIALAHLPPDAHDATDRSTRMRSP